MEIATLIARVIVGGVFIAAGALKIGHFNDLAATIAGFRLVPAVVIGPIAILLPFIELIVGVYLLVGLYTRIVASVALANMIVFSAAIASVVIRGIPAACGCFGPGDATPASWVEVARDLALAAVAAFIVWRAPGMLAIDRRIQGES